MPDVLEFFHSPVAGGVSDLQARQGGHPQREQEVGQRHGVCERADLGDRPADSHSDENTRDEDL